MTLYDTITTHMLTCIWCWLLKGCISSQLSPPELLAVASESTKFSTILSWVWSWPETFSSSFLSSALNFGSTRGPLLDEEAWSPEPEPKYLWDEWFRVDTAACCCDNISNRLKRLAIANVDIPFTFFSYWFHSACKISSTQKHITCSHRKQEVGRKILETFYIKTSKKNPWQALLCNAIYCVYDFFCIVCHQIIYRNIRHSFNK